MKATILFPLCACITWFGIIILFGIVWIDQGSPNYSNSLFPSLWHIGRSIIAVFIPVMCIFAFFFCLSMFQFSVLSYQLGLLRSFKYSVVALCFGVTSCFCLIVSVCLATGSKGGIYLASQILYTIFVILFNSGLANNFLAIDCFWEFRFEAYGPFHYKEVCYYIKLFYNFVSLPLGFSVVIMNYVCYEDNSITCYRVNTASATMEWSLNFSVGLYLITWVADIYYIKKIVE